MTGKELADILEEIDQLKAKLYGRTFVVPEGSGMCAPCRSGGRCVECDKEFQPWDLIRRNCFVRMTEDGPVVIGQRVCYRCSPHVKDWMLDRYKESIDHWPERWKQYLDTGIYKNRRAYRWSAFDNSEEPWLADQKQHTAPSAE